MGKHILLVIVALCSTVVAQTQDAYETDESSSKKGLLDPSRLSLSNSLSFGMASSGSSNLQSQSLYSTMLQYRFNAPVTVNLNFGLPIHSTISSAQNLSKDNIQSLEYFKTMPVSASVLWRPTEKMSFMINIERNSYYSYNAFPYFYNDGLFSRLSLARDSVSK